MCLVLGFLIVLNSLLNVSWKLGPPSLINTLGRVPVISFALRWVSRHRISDHYKIFCVAADFSSISLAIHVSSTSFLYLLSTLHSASAMVWINFISGLTATLLKCSLHNTATIAS